MNTTYYFVEALDTWSFRGNRAFGESGSYGETVFPPPPSVIAGAFRSLLLGSMSSEIGAFTRGTPLSDPALSRILGTPDEPGSFRVSLVSPARCDGDGGVERLTPLPADLVVANKGECVLQMNPEKRPPELLSSAPYSLPCLPVLRQTTPAKPESGWLLTGDGLANYQCGASLKLEHLVSRHSLWAEELRIGIGMQDTSRSAEEGQLFSLQHTAPCHGDGGVSSAEPGLLVGLQGCEERLPDTGMLRLGGDGRGAVFRQVQFPAPSIPAEQIQSTHQFKLVLQTPGLFGQGWLPDGIQDEGKSLALDWQGLRARLICATLPRHTVISGWDLAYRRPKSAQRAVPAGSVYWFELLQGDLQQLDKLVDQGLWALVGDNIDRQREAEGYNRVLIAAG